MNVFANRAVHVRRTLALILIALAALALPTPPLAAAQSPPTADAVLAQMDREAKDFRSLTAHIERTKVTVAVDDRSTESGEMQVRRDDKMRIDLSVPDPKTILRDGDHLYVYNPRIHRVEEQWLGQAPSNNFSACATSPG